MRIAIVGATGAVGAEFGDVLTQRNFPFTEARLFASARSAGRTLHWGGADYKIAELSADAFAGVDIAFFSAGAELSRQFAPHAVKAGAVVIDNSSAFRMDENVPLVVPEVNAAEIARHNGIIANPNCSAIILTVALAPLRKLAKIRRIVVSTYQAASGAGARALEELVTQSRAALDGQPIVPEVFPVQCAFNVFSHNTKIGPDGYNGEESKMILETQKILGDAAVRIAPTCMRVPVLRAHTESVSVEFDVPVSEQQARDVLEYAPGIKVVDDRATNHFPTPLDASGRDEVLVGRIRTDASIADNRGLQFICAGDQLRKGAALNAVQIAERLKS
ncbi:MAG: aspartate-semialdehyde dehydrogenase [Phycisphaerae bacterium]